MYYLISESTFNMTVSTTSCFLKSLQQSGDFIEKIFQHQRNGRVFLFLVLKITAINFPKSTINSVVCVCVGVCVSVWFVRRSHLLWFYMRQISSCMYHSCKCTYRVSYSTAIRGTLVYAASMPSSSAEKSREIINEFLFHARTIIGEVVIYANTA